MDTDHVTPLGKAKRRIVSGSEVIDFLHKVSQRTVGDEGTDLNFVGDYCRFAIMIVGKRSKVSWSIQPYVDFIRGNIEKIKCETLYLIGDAKNTSSICYICSIVSNEFECLARAKISTLVRFRDRQEIVPAYLAVLRSRTRDAVVPKSSGPAVHARCSHR